MSMPTTPDGAQPLDLDEIRDQLTESSGIIDRPDVHYNWAALSAQRVAERLLGEVERLNTWRGLMSLLDENYPASVFPTEEDHAERDDGPRIISLIRHLDHARSSEVAAHEALGELSEQYGLAVRALDAAAVIVATLKAKGWKPENEWFIPETAPFVAAVEAWQRGDATNPTAAGG